jgi:enoyl-CoA hydratase
MTSSEISTTYALDEHAARIRLNRPGRLNAVSPTLYDGIETGLERVADDTTRAQRLCAHTDDHEKPVAAFEQNRKPEIKGT